MIHPLIERNRRLLQFYYIVARIIGLIFLLMGVCVLLNLLLFSKTNGNQEPFKTATFVLVLFGGFKYVFYALIVRGAGELIRCLFVDEYSPNWTLRHGSKILYLYAVFLIGSCVWSYVCIEIVSEASLRYLVHETIVKVLVAVGLGRILQRIVMPIIEAVQKKDGVIKGSDPY